MNGMPGIHKQRALEDILACKMNGDDNYRSIIPCRSIAVRLQGKNYTPAKKQEKNIA